jgi:hypothetical protein
MAIWQYTFHVLLKEKVEEFPKYLIENREEGFDDSIFWEGMALNRDVFYPINALLPKGTSWCANIDLYGHQKSTLLEVLHKGDMVESVSFRIDYTTNYEAILRQLIEFFTINGFVIVDEDINVLPMNFEIIKSVVDNSRQVKTYNWLSKS